MKRILIIASILLFSSIMGFTSQVSADDEDMVNNLTLLVDGYTTSEAYTGQEVTADISLYNIDGDDSITYEINWEDGTWEQETIQCNGDNSQRIFKTHTYSTASDYCVCVYILDGDSWKCRDMLIIDSSPPPGCPDIEQFYHNSEGWIGTPVNFYVRADMETDGLIRYRIQYSNVHSDVKIEEPNTQVTFTHTYYHATTYDVRVIAEKSDDSGCNSGWQEDQITIHADAPTPPPEITSISLSDDHIYIEDEAVLSVTATSADFNNLDYEIYWGHETTNGIPGTETHYMSEGTQTFDHIYPFSGWFTIRAHVEDADNNFDEKEIDIFVTTTPPAPPEPPELLHFAITNNNPEIGQLIESMIIGTDPDSEDALQIKMDWGDGTTETKLYSQDSGCIFAYEYNTEGTYTTTATVTDMDGMSDSDTLTVTVEDQDPPESPTFGKITNVAVSGTPYDEAGDTLTFTISMKNDGQTAGDINCEITETNYGLFTESGNIHLTPNQDHTFIFSSTFDEAGDLRFVTTVQAETSNTIDDSYLTLVSFEAPPPEDPEDPEPDPGDDDDDDDEDPDDDDDEDGDGVPDDQDGDDDGDGIPDTGQFNPQINWTLIIIAIAGCLIALKLVNFRLKKGRWPYQKKKTQTPNQKHLSTSDYDMIIDYGNDTFNDTGDDFPSH